MEDLIAIVAGGTGEVGEGIVRSLLRRGATVVVPYRDEGKAETLREYAGGAGPGRLECLPGVMGDFASAEKFRDQVLKRHGRVDLAAASLGGWFEDQELHRLSYRDWNRLMRDNLHSHFIFASMFLPVLYERNTGMYVNLNGSSIDEIMPGAGVISVLGAALNKMTEVFAKEAERTEVRIYSVALFTPVITRGLKGPVEPGWVSAEQTGDYICRLYSGDVPNVDSPVHKIYSTNGM